MSERVIPLSSRCGYHKMAPRSSLVLRFFIIAVFVCFIYPTLYVKVFKFGRFSTSQSSTSFGKFGERERRSLKVNESLSRVYINIPESQRVANCVKPSIDDFPSDFMTQYERQHGAVAAHIVIALYMFGALAVVCDDYFVSSLERICEGLKLKSDVAGATFMAAGSSAPEFFTSVIGVFITKGDIGLGTIVGSAVFNILFIVAICGIFSGCVLKLSWWPLMRDCIYYLISIAALVVVTYDKEVYWYEALVLVIMYIFYVIIMYFNTRLEDFFTGLFDKEPVVKSGNRGEEREALISGDDDDSFKGSDIYESDEGVSKEVDVVSFTSCEDSDSPFTMPRGFFKGILWIIFIPISCIFYITIPDCRKPRWKNWYFATFLLSVIWIAGLSYLLVWMVEIIGYTLEIPDVIMGLTFLAAGSSVPDGISSLLVARQGDGDMAVSNTVGSNVFDILLCLGFPWLLKTTVVKLNSTVHVISGSILYTSISLFGTVFVTVLLISLNRWRLNKCLGIIFLLLYIAFISVATLFELNIFGDFNLPVCGT
ncbi:sodium/potassium/calcium exchanger 4-like [Actinia tenebrosa]|uniref:Sodium/potassium/calcium exchanger 4-like n=1 Tax=Actinia tenebrosa TaxID=6105 RepID=A0A6P8J2W4_ACTTE|nr:sodium/potassium/calcium exchanger 4-like [Actinia tenebrosa]